ncbi:MAG TPA: CapA family protein [Ohtaekwangia sp.]|nr:CapA family protein [Ohtaekwangia sp.]
MKIFLSILFAFLVIQLHAQDTTRLSLIFAGDIMGHDSQIAAAYDPIKKRYDYSNCFRFVKPYLAGADLAIGNLELTFAGRPYKGYPQFSSPDALGVTLKDIGFDVLVTSNNHCVDRGRKGLERTIAVLDSLSIPHTGTFVDTVSRMNDYPLMVRKNGFVIAVLNYTYGTNGLPVTRPNIVNRLDTAIMRKDLKKACELKPDAIIVFTHWGAEYQSLPSKGQKDLADFCFRHGAKIVIGAHPHVIQPIEWRKQKDQLVAYSLGNFISGQRKRYTDGGSMVYLELEKVAYAADSSATSIDSAGYALEWVYRTADAKKHYYIIPVEKGEKDSVQFIADVSSRDAFKIFARDSRQLFSKYNVGVGEIRLDNIRQFAPSDSVACNTHILKRTQEKIAILTSDDVRLFLSTFNNACGNHVEFKEWSNELLFTVLHQHTLDFLSVLQDTDAMLNTVLILQELSSPISDKISIDDLLSRIDPLDASLKYKNVIRESLLKAREQKKN